MKNTVSTFLSMKQNGERLTEITSYDYTTAKLVEKAGINAILVGDSLGMTMMGYDDPAGYDGGHDPPQRLRRARV